VAVDGIVVVDKPAGMTSHDVVSRIRRLARTRRVGHAGTLDPMATGVLVLGVERATRLLGHLALEDKSYEAIIRLGVATHTDDAEGEVVSRAPAGHLTSDQISAGVAELTGEILQVPSAVSAVKVGGERAYRKVRAGQRVELSPRRVVVSRFDVRDVRRVGDEVELNVVVDCSSGTYIRALARDLGAGLGVGGHLRALRRTRVGRYGLDRARSLAELEADFRVQPIAEVAAETFPRYDLDEETARLVGFGQRLPNVRLGADRVAMFAPDGRFLALYEDTEQGARPIAVFAG
jgi:tRNA pseudouridine55 synthase